jgi:DNA-nicking Smr family endonuclease
MVDDVWEIYIKGIKPLKINNKIPISIPKPNSSSYLSSDVSVVPNRLRKPWENNNTNNPNQSVSVVDPKNFKKKTIQARLDLHGHTMASAEIALKRFFNAVQCQDFRFVLVITGKGHVEHRGVIRTFTVQWFKENSKYVVGYTQAAPKDGGAGAFYVHVRRCRDFV